MLWPCLRSVQFYTYLQGGLCLKASVSSFVEQDINTYSLRLLSVSLSERLAFGRCQSKNTGPFFDKKTSFLNTTEKSGK